MAGRALWPALIAVALLGAAAALPVHSGVPADPVAAPALVAPEEVVYGYLDALDRGDAATAAGFVAPGATAVAVPGLPVPLGGADRAALQAALAFSTAVVDVDVTGCQTASAVVTCDGRLESAYARAVGIGGRVVPVTYVVEAGAIASIQPAPAGIPDAAGYCAWAQPAHAHVFTAGCEPATGPGLASAHRRLAREYVAALRNQ